MVCAGFQGLGHVWLSGIWGSRVWGLSRASTGLGAFVVLGLEGFKALGREGLVLQALRFSDTLGLEII